MSFILHISPCLLIKYDAFIGFPFDIFMRYKMFMNLFFQLLIYFLCPVLFDVYKEKEQSQ